MTVSDATDVNIHSVTYRPLKATIHTQHPSRSAAVKSEARGPAEAPAALEEVAVKVETHKAETWRKLSRLTGPAGSDRFCPGQQRGTMSHGDDCWTSGSRTSRTRRTTGQKTFLGSHIHATAANTETVYFTLSSG